jgi:hypothetical protein
VAHLFFCDKEYERHWSGALPAKLGRTRSKLDGMADLEAA